jgi:hypothetical protein
VIPLLDKTTGFLPPGRHVCTADEVEEVFVRGEAFSGSASRSKIWSDWNDALALLQSAVTVHAVWIGGSFTTAKLDPEDIDVTYIVNANEVRGLQGKDELNIIGIFNTPGRVKSELRLDVDNFLIWWEYIPSPIALNPSQLRLQDLYYWARGHWDDWWQRARQGPKDSPPTVLDAVPRRGYLEVPVSDYII